MHAGCATHQLTRCEALTIQNATSSSRSRIIIHPAAASRSVGGLVLVRTDPGRCSAVCSSAMTQGAGEVAFLFTDVEGSTRLWEEHREEMAVALAAHDHALRTAIASAGGEVFATGGDSIAAVFATPARAVAASVEGQRALRSLVVGGTPLRVRMAVHVGEAERRGGDYFGPALNRCARLMAAAHGGQVLLSGRVAMACGEQLGAFTLRDLGEHRLKDLTEPEHVFQVVHPDLLDGFGSLRSLGSYTTNLPSYTTSFLGRERDTATLSAAIGNHRLVTLVGPAGTGKTRLATHTAAELLDLYPGGVWVVDLLSITDPDGVPGSFLSVVGYSGGAGGDEISVLEQWLVFRRALLIVDNCEPLVEETSRVLRRLLSRCPQLRVLATSRRPLGVGGEHLISVEPLAVPVEGEPEGGLALLREVPAVQLLVERARAVSPGFHLDASNAPLIVDLCRRLDGIPLAIELAAARLRTMALSDLNARLDRRFRILTTPWDRANRHHQTLSAAIEWSYGLLEPNHRLAFRRLGVFEGSFTLQAAEAVCGLAPLDPFDVASILADLVDHSLVIRVSTQGEQTRYRLLETLRAYARERASEDPTDLALATRTHAIHFREGIGGLEQVMFGARQGELLARLEDELPDLRLAMNTWEEQDPVAALRMATELGTFFFIHGRAREGEARLNRLRSGTTAIPVDLAARAAFQHAQLAWGLEQLDQAEHWCREALTGFTTIDDLSGRARCLSLLGRLLLDAGDDGAETLLREAAATAQAAGEMRWSADALHFLGILHRRRGDPRQAFRLHRRSWLLFQSVGDLNGVGFSLGAAGLDLWILGRSACALRLMERAQQQHEKIGERRGVAQGLQLLALFRLAVGDFDGARRDASQSIRLSQETGGQQNGALLAVATLALRSGDLPLSQRCLAASRAYGRDRLADLIAAKPVFADVLALKATSHGVDDPEGVLADALRFLDAER
jgi:predicted ATPase/class 3 adenylate cyclase